MRTIIALETHWELEQLLVRVSYNFGSWQAVIWSLIRGDALRYLYTESGSLRSSSLKVYTLTAYTIGKGVT